MQNRARALMDSIIVLILGTDDAALHLEIEGQPYSFKPNADNAGLKVDDMAAHFGKLLPQGASAALSWLRSVADEVDGSAPVEPKQDTPPAEQERPVSNPPSDQ